MENIYIKIEKYLKQNFPKKQLVLKKSLTWDALTNDGADVWGIYSVPIIVQQVGDKVYYKPIFK